VRYALGAVAIGLTLAGCTLSGLWGSSATDAGAGAVVGRWTVQSSVAPTRLGGLAVSVRPPRPPRRPGSRAFLVHDLVFENVGRRPLLLTGTRSIAAFIGPAGHRRRLLANGELCGWVPQQPGFRLEVACLAMLDVTTLKPGGSHAVTISLIKGLRGMEPFVPGRYELRFRVGIGRPSTPAGQPRDARLTISYEIDTRSTRR
jgi:hypothetical protein